jgi:hypothetical protein
MEPLNNPNQNTGTKGKGLIFTQKKKKKKKKIKKKKKKKEKKKKNNKKKERKKQLKGLLIKRPKLKRTTI